MKQKTSQLVIRISPTQKDSLRLLSESAGVSMAAYIITKLKLDKKPLCGRAKG